MASRPLELVSSVFLHPFKQLNRRENAASPWLYYTTLHYITLHCTTLHYTALHYTTLHYTTLHYTALHYTTLHYTTLHCTALHCTIHYTTLHYTALHCTTQRCIALYTTLHYTALHYTAQHNTTQHIPPHDTAHTSPTTFFNHITPRHATPTPTLDLGPPHTAPPHYKSDCDTTTQVKNYCQQE